WNNHHHLLKAVERIDGRVLWANLHLLFWLSLFPFVTAWMSENRFAPIPTALYGGVLLMAALAWPLLVHTLVAAESPRGRIAKAMGRDAKGKLSIALYALAIVLALLVNPWIACALYVTVALIWFVPDRR